MNDLSVQIFRCGEVGVDPTVPHRELSKNPWAFTGLFRNKKRRIYLPVKCFLITHPSGKRILVDAAWDSRVREHPISTITYPMWYASKPILKEGEAIDEQLKAIGVEPRDLDSVVMTHLDIDHTSGLRLVKDAPKIYASEEEIKATHSLDARYTRKPLKGIPLLPIPWNGVEGPFQRSYDYFGDGSVLILFTPGHSRGSVSIKVQKSGHYVLLVGDTGYNEDSWEKGYLPGPLDSKADMRKSLAWVKEGANDPTCLGVYCAHDPSDRSAPEIIILP